MRKVTRNLFAALLLAGTALAMGAPALAEQAQQDGSVTPRQDMGPGMMGQGMMGQGMMGQGMMGQGPMGQGPMSRGMMGQGMMQGGGAPDGYAMPYPWMMQPQSEWTGHGGGYWHPPMHRGMQMRPWSWNGCPGQGMHGYGMMGHPMMRQGMMPHPGMMQGMMQGQGLGPGMIYGQGGGAPEVTPELVRDLLERQLAWHGNPNLKVGEVAAEDGRIFGEIVTKDGSLVNRLAFDPETGRWMDAN